MDTTFTVSTDEVFQEREEVVTVKGVNQWHLEAEYFADRVLGNEPISYPMENGLAQTKVMDAIYASAREGRVVNL